MRKHPPEEAAMPYRPTGEPAQSAVAAIKERHEPELMAIDGVEGVGVGSRGGREVILAYVRDEEACRQLPRELEGVPVAVEVTGVIEAY